MCFVSAYQQALAAQNCAAAAQASHNAADYAAFSAMVAALRRTHGDAYAGMDHLGRVILWRESTVPKVRRK
jgi:hypothetical protein